MKHFLILTIWLGLGGCYNNEPKRPDLKGSKLPTFQLLLTDSTTYFNTSNIPVGGSIVLLFFGPHCPYSRAQINEIIEYMPFFKNINFYIFTTPTAFSEMKEFYNSYQLQKYNNIKVGVDFTNFFVTYFKAPGVPYIAIYGKNRKLNEAILGVVNGKQIKNIAEQ